MGKMYKKISPGRHIAINVLIVSILSVFVFVIITILSWYGGKKTFFGLKPIVITTESMIPEILPGALIISKETPLEELNINDIITYELIDGQWNTDKVVKKDEKGVWTMGMQVQNNDFIPLTKSNYRYKVIAIMNWAAKIRTPADFAKYIASPILVLSIAIGIFIMIYKRRSPRNIDIIHDMYKPEIEEVADFEQITGMITELQQSFAEFNGEINKIYTDHEKFDLLMSENESLKRQNQALLAENEKQQAAIKVLESLLDYYNVLK